jgi:hypothetical protein
MTPPILGSSQAWMISIDRWRSDGHLWEIAWNPSVAVPD